MTLTPEEFIKKIEESENYGTTKSTHTKNPTTCKDVRRSGQACGICGSYNIVHQGLKYCITCGKEVEILSTETYFWWFDKKEHPICNCPYIRRSEKYSYKISPRKEYYIGKCLDCGSVNSPRLCPNCGTLNKIGDVWKHWDGRIKCSSCGFTITDSIMCNIGSNFKGKNKQGKLGTKKSKMKSKKYMSKRKQKKLDAKNKVHPNKIL